jgi:hypothetical protein
VESRRNSSFISYYSKKKMSSTPHASPHGTPHAPPHGTPHGTPRTPSRKRKVQESLTPGQSALLRVAKNNEHGRKAAEKVIAEVAAEERKERKESRTAILQSLGSIEMGRQSDMATLAVALTPAGKGKKKPPPTGVAGFAAASHDDDDDDVTTSFLGGLFSKAKDYVTPSKKPSVLYELSDVEEESDDEESDSKPAARPDKESDDVAEEDKEDDDAEEEDKVAEEDKEEADADEEDIQADVHVNLWANKSAIQLKAELTPVRIKNFAKLELNEAFYACFDKDLIAYSGLHVKCLQEFCKGFGHSPYGGKRDIVKRLTKGVE